MKIKILISVICLPILCYHAKQSTSVCPKPPPFNSDFCSRATFIPGCFDDSDCSSNDEKCCPTGECHINNCVKPLRHKSARGFCPEPPEFDPVFCSLVDIRPGCQDDSDCIIKGQRCCPSGPCHVLDCVKPIRRPYY